MFKFSLSLGLVFFLFSQTVLAKVELYAPKVLEPNSDGYVRILFSGRTFPNSKVSINLESSIIVKSTYPLKFNPTPSSLKEFSNIYQNNLQNKKEGLFRIKKGCPIHEAPTDKSKKKILADASPQWGHEVNNTWLQVFGSRAGFVLKKCILQSKINVREINLTRTATSDINGDFELLTNLPEGSLQVLFLIDSTTISRHLFSLEVSPKSVQSNIKFSDKKTVTALAQKPSIKQTNIENSPTEVKEDKKAVNINHDGKWSYSADIGLGYNYHDFNQEISSAEDIGFNNSSIAAPTLELFASTKNWGLRFGYSKSSAELKSASAPYTLLNLKYDLNSVDFTANYFFSSEPNVASYGLGFGYQTFDAPFLVVGAGSNVNIDQMSLNYVLVSYFYKPSQNIGTSYPWEAALLVPTNASGPSGSNVDGGIGGHFKIGARTQWHSDFYTLFQGTIKQLSTTYDYDINSIQNSGSHKILSSQLDLKVGLQF